MFIRTSSQNIIPKSQVRGTAVQVFSSFGGQYMENSKLVLAKISIPAFDQNAACAHIDVLSAAKLLLSRDPGDRTKIYCVTV